MTTATTSSYLQASIPIIEAFEGKVPWMYLDTDTPANVTALIGQEIPDVAAAQALPWRTHDFSRYATAKEVAADFERVQAMNGGGYPSHYTTPTCLQMLDADIYRILESELTAIDAELAAFYGNYAAWPDPAKIATLDIAFNLGLGELKRGYPHFNAAAQSGYWLTCTAQCHRDGISVARNSWTQAQFSEAYSIARAA